MEQQTIKVKNQKPEIKKTFKVNGIEFVKTKYWTHPVVIPCDSVYQCCYFHDDEPYVMYVRIKEQDDIYPSNNIWEVLANGVPHLQEFTQSSAAGFTKFHCRW